MTNLRRILAGGALGVLAAAAQHDLAHAQAQPAPTAQYCSSTGTTAGPWEPCPIMGGSGGTSNVNLQQYGGIAVGAGNAQYVQPGTGATFPISASGLPLPTGASTSALQSSVQSAPGTPQTTAVTIQGNASGVAVPVTGSVTSTPGTTTLSYASPTSVSVPTSSTTILGSGTYTHFISLCTSPTSTGNVWLNLAGGAATTNVGISLAAGGGCEVWTGTNMPTAAITGISDSGTNTVTIQGG